jgi:hypothetical protein
MRQLYVLIAAAAGLGFALWISAARAEIGPCRQADFDYICGNGIGAARAIAKTISPSRRFAFAWRLADKSPANRPEDGDPNLENLVIRLEDGAVLAKSTGSYWDLGTKIAKAFLFTAWSPGSRLLVKVEQRAESASAELFSFAQSDAAVGPVDLVKVIKPALLAKMQGARDTENSVLIFAAHPAMTIDDQGLMRATVFTREQDATEGARYDAIVQVTSKVDSLAANVVSVALRTGTSISIIVH